MRKVFMTSDMRIPYEEESCYLIEDSSRVAKLKGVKIVEFVQVVGSAVRMLEAKSTAPRPLQNEDYYKYLKGIQEKFQNCISLLNAAKLNRRPDIFDEFPTSLKDLDYGSARYCLYLVIKNSKEDWVVNLNDDFRKLLHPFLKCWNIRDQDFQVLTEKMAQAKGLVLNEESTGLE